MITAVAADEPAEPRPSFAAGGIVTGPNTVLMTDGCVWPTGGGTVVHPAGTITVTINQPQFTADEIAAFLRRRRKPSN